MMIDLDLMKKSGRYLTLPLIFSMCDIVNAMISTIDSSLFDDDFMYYMSAAFMYSLTNSRSSRGSMMIGLLSVLVFQNTSSKAPEIMKLRLSGLISHASCINIIHRSLEVVVVFKYLFSIEFANCYGCVIIISI